MYPYMSKPKTEKKIKIPDKLIFDLLTPSEIRMLKNRWQILNFLKDGISIRRIAKEVKVGTDTVVRVVRMIEKSNLRKLLNKEGNLGRKINTNTPWIFGKSND